MDTTLENAYTDILTEELTQAIGCMEPIAVALCAAKAQQTLGMQPTAVTVSAGVNILKHVKHIVVPHTGGLTGLRAAVAAGILCGDADKGAQVLDEGTAAQHDAIARFAETLHIDVLSAETESPIYISVTLYARTSYARAVISDRFTHIAEVMKNGEVLLHDPLPVQNEDRQTDRACLRFYDILAYADAVDLATLAPLLEGQIAGSMAIAKEGLQRPYGAQIGKMLLLEQTSDAKTVAKAYAAAGNDARMGGSMLPIPFLCGSGSQGMAACVPLVCYARHHAVSKERLYRAMLVTDLLTVYLNTVCEARRNRCTAYDAGCAASVGIAYLSGGKAELAAQAFLHALSLKGETLCSGAGAACAWRAAAAVDTGILGFQMAQRHLACEDAQNDVDAVLRHALAENAASGGDALAFSASAIR